MRRDGCLPVREFEGGVSQLEQGGAMVGQQLLQRRLKRTSGRSNLHNCASVLMNWHNLDESANFFG